MIPHKEVVIVQPIYNVVCKGVLAGTGIAICIQLPNIVNALTTIAEKL